MRRSRTPDARTWWGERRATFNAALIASGLTSFALYVMVVESRCAATPGAHPRVMSPATLLLAVGYAVALGGASVAYRLGPRIEARVPQARRDAYRRWAYGVALALASTLPLLVPSLAYRACVPW
jgi:hypothetical protein